MENDKVKEMNSEENDIKENTIEEKTNPGQSEPDSTDNIFKDNEIDLEMLECLSDDEAVLELDKLTGQNDELIEKDYLSSLIKQEDRLVYFEIENIYNNPKKKVFRNRFKMRKDPPILVLKDNFGNEAQFCLTENLTDELSEALKQVKRAYYGFHSPSDINTPEGFLNKIKYYVKKNPYKIVITITLIMFIFALNLI